MTGGVASRRRQPLAPGTNFQARAPEPAPALAAAMVLAMIYLFLVGIGFIESGIASFGVSFQDWITQRVANPLSGLSAGILATVLMQSSSATTATIVGLVGSGTLPVEYAVPMVMGANMGTTVTSTLAALGSLRRGDEFRRAFAGATVHDFFNLISVTVLFPLEIATGFLARSAAALTGVVRGTGAQGGSMNSPIRDAVQGPVDLVASAFSGVATAVTATLLLLAGLVLVLVALRTITVRMRALVADHLERAMNRAVSRGGGVIGILIGLVVTMMVQSSTITTSILVPLLAAGVLTLPNAFPITVGANIGTTITALIASLAVVRPEGLTIALVHALFNIIAACLIYPVPAIRRLPVMLAESLAGLALRRRWVIVAYVSIVFIVAPLVVLVVLG